VNSTRLLPTILCVLFFFPAASEASNQLPATNAPIIVVALENESYLDVVGSPYMPYYNGLITQYGLATQFYANVHGSFPDYAMLTTGELITSAGWGLPGDFPISIDNIVREMVKAAKTWRVYAENLPWVGYTGGDSYPYVKRHNPFAYMTDVVGKSQANNLVPFTQWTTDLAANALPNFSFVVPNVQHDGNECPGGGQNCANSAKLSAVDQWLQTNVTAVFQNPAFQKGGVLILWWDEGDSSDKAHVGGQVAVVFAGPNIKPGYMSTTFYRHEHLLRTIVELLGINAPGCTVYVPSMAEFFVGH